MDHSQTFRYLSLSLILSEMSKATLVSVSIIQPACDSQGRSA